MVLPQKNSWLLVIFLDIYGGLKRRKKFLLVILRIKCISENICFLKIIMATTYNSVLNIKAFTNSKWLHLNSLFRRDVDIYNLPRHDIWHKIFWKSLIFIFPKYKSFFSSSSVLWLRWCWQIIASGFSKTRSLSVFTYCWDLKIVM